jgi:AcrR family transcriptional regulator
MADADVRPAPGTHAVIRRTALALFEAGGYGGTTVAQVAAGAGVDPMTVYRHFGTKHGLVLRLGDDPDITTRIGDALKAAGGPNGTVIDAVQGVAMEWIDQASSELLSEAYRVVRLIKATPELQERAWSTVPDWARIYAPSLAGRTRSRDLVQVEVATRMMVSAIVSAALAWADSRGSRGELIAALEQAMTAARSLDHV